MVTKEEILKSQGKLCMDLIAEGLGFQEVGCWLRAVMEDTIAAGPHHMGDGQQLFNKSSLPGLETSAWMLGMQVLFLYGRPLEADLTQ